MRPGAELYLATPGFVAIIGKASVKVHAGVEASTYDAEDSATFTNLDQSRTVDPGAKGAFKRYEEGATLITRCGVQVTAVASAESMLLGLTKDAGPPLPAASIGILTAQQIKHARERSLDCAFAGAHALACVVWIKAGERDRRGHRLQGGRRLRRAHARTRRRGSSPVAPSPRAARRPRRGLRRGLVCGRRRGRSEPGPGPFGEPFSRKIGGPRPALAPRWHGKRAPVPPR